MATTHGIGRSIMPYLISGAILAATALGYVGYRQIEPQQQRPAATAQQPSQGSIDDKVGPTQAPSAAPAKPAATAAPAAPKKPPMPDLTMMVTDFKQVEQLVAYIADQLGYPLSPNQEIKFLPKEEFDPLYKEKIKSSEVGPAFTEVRLRAGNILGKTYLRQDEFYQTIGALFHELGVFNSDDLNLRKGKTDNSIEEANEAMAFAFHSAGISILEEKFGLENFFVQSRNQSRNILNGLNYAQNSYFRDGFKPIGGIIAYWGVILKEPQLKHIGAEVRLNKKLSSNSEIAVFEFLSRQNNGYIKAMIQGMTPEDFKEIERILTSRGLPSDTHPIPDFLSWDYFLTQARPQHLAYRGHQNL